MLLSAVAVCGCAQPRPLAIEEIDDPSLLLIMNALEETIRAAREDRDTAWFSGHLGNAWVNLWGEPNYGLCYHWQELVYHGVLPTVREVGWEARGVQINIGTMNEHHAVLIIDPQRVALESGSGCARRAGSQRTCWTPGAAVERTSTTSRTGSLCRPRSGSRPSWKICRSSGAGGASWAQRSRRGDLTPCCSVSSSRSGARHS